MIICGPAVTDVAVDFASAEGTTIAIVPNINDKIINFLIIPPLFDFTSLIEYATAPLRRFDTPQRRLFGAKLCKRDVSFSYVYGGSTGVYRNHRAQKIAL